MYIFLTKVVIPYKYEFYSHYNIIKFIDFESIYWCCFILYGLLNIGVIKDEITLRLIA